MTDILCAPAQLEQLEDVPKLQEEQPSQQDPEQLQEQQAHELQNTSTPEQQMMEAQAQLAMLPLQQESALPVSPEVINYTVHEDLVQSSSITAGEDTPSGISHSSGAALASIRAARAEAAAAVAAAAAAPTMTGTINRAKAALAKARASSTSVATAGKPAAGSLSPTGGPDGSTATPPERPFTLYGSAEPPKPRPPVHVSAPSQEESDRRRAWQAEKAAMRERRLEQDAARRQREELTRQAEVAERAEEHRRLIEQRKAKYEAFKEREAELLKSSQAAWKQYQAERGRPPLFRVMEDGFAARVAAEEAERRAAYQTEVAAAKLATVRQLVTGEVVIKPPAGATSPGRNSPGRSRSPGGSIVRASLGSAEHCQMLGRISPGSRNTSSPSPTGSGGGITRSGAAAAAAAAARHKWPGDNASAVAAAARQLVDRACSPLVLPAADAATALGTPGQLQCSALSATGSKAVTAEEQGQHGPCDMLLTLEQAQAAASVADNSSKNQQGSEDDLDVQLKEVEIIGAQAQSEQTALEKEDVSPQAAETGLNALLLRGSSTISHQTADGSAALKESETEEVAKGEGEATDTDGAVVEEGVIQASMSADTGAADAESTLDTAALDHQYETIAEKPQVEGSIAIEGETNQQETNQQETSQQETSQQEQLHGKMPGGPVASDPAEVTVMAEKVDSEPDSEHRVESSSS